METDCATRPNSTMSNGQVFPQREHPETCLQLAQSTPSVKKVTHSKPQAGNKPAPYHQVGKAGDRNLSTPGFALKSKILGVGTIPALDAAVGPVLGPKSYAQALVGLAGPGRDNFSCTVLPVKAYPPLNWKNPMTPAAKPVRNNDQPGQDGPPTSKTTVPENLKNDHEESNQTAEPEMPSLTTQIVPEECPEAIACE
ncbi:hypothetical protein DSO57_1008845 [Entomophthora muscae]|uniref:Uncharacterized protein n=1 Tax=Entomophthora muscae TaxID=34485 RepID=A0ACC2S8Z1_9FUNG|nr:hypothetical protein DSO57_1008845 [Entomophthora muscae]